MLPPRPLSESMLVESEITTVKYWRNCRTNISTMLNIRRLHTILSMPCSTHGNPSRSSRTHSGSTADIMAVKHTMIVVVQCENAAVESTSPLRTAAKTATSHWW